MKYLPGYWGTVAGGCDPAAHKIRDIFMRKKLSALAVLATASVFALTGCSAGEQSVADACKIANDSMSSLAGELNSGLTNMATDPSGAADLFTKMETKLKEAEGKITNSEVKGLLTTVLKDFSDVNVVMQKMKDGGIASLSQDDSTKMMEAGTNMQKSGAELTKVCGA